MSATTYKTQLGRLPFEIREDICRRLYNRQTAKTINAWLISQGFGPYNNTNFTNFKKTHYEKWLQEENRNALIRREAEENFRRFQAAGESPYEKLAYDYAAALADARSSASPENITKLAGAVSAIIGARTSQVRAEQEARKIEQKDVALKLEEKKFQLNFVEGFLKWFEDRKAIEIAAGSGSNSEKINRLGQLMFGDDWNQ
jgi:hypothetical protein